MSMESIWIFSRDNQRACYLRGSSLLCSLFDKERFKKVLVKICNMLDLKRFSIYSYFKGSHDPLNRMPAD